MSFFALVTLVSMGNYRPVVVRKNFPPTLLGLVNGACELN